jgi:leucyl aminopeptidase
LEWPINVVGIVPAAENMPSGTAQRPGDVIRTAKGVTVEVLNTDAEGRLILADALYHASGFKPTAIIDLATLTGACMVALGSQASGLMGNDNSLLRQLEQAGEATGERVWRLPMYSEYQELIKSTVADIKNIGGRWAGAITAGCFLSRFVEEKQAWAHIDIAGTAYDMSSGRPHYPKGAAGVGVRLLSRFIQTHWM